MFLNHGRGIVSMFSVCTFKLPDSIFRLLYFATANISSKIVAESVNNECTCISSFGESIFIECTVQSLKMA